jgi:spore maturation protein CgeB
LRLVVFGLTLSSSWGNGHATTYRALLKAFAARGHDVTFFERDESWYADNRDLGEPDFCRLILYKGLNDLARFGKRIDQADAIVVGSFVRDGIPLAKKLCARRDGVTAFYDIDAAVRCLFLVHRRAVSEMDRKPLPRQAGGAALLLG